MERDPITGFKVKFNILDYADILPDAPYDPAEIINWDNKSEDSVWIRQEPEKITPEYVQQEVTRVLRTGVWIFINLQPIWIPPNYYFFLQYFKVGGEYPEFRLSRLKSVYFQIRVRNNPYAIGIFTIKSRQIGETSFEMSNCLHEAAKGNLEYGSIGIQSKTNQTVKESCWRILTGGWQSIPRWLKDVLYSDIKSEDAIATKMQWIKPATETEVERDVLIMYGSSTDNSFDSMNNMRFCLLDEVLKWRENSFYSTFLNYEKFIAPGKSRRGLFKIFSSPADFECTSSIEGLEFWKQSDPAKLDENGTTQSRVFRFYASPLEGLQDMYDKFGDADADEIFEWIKKKRKSVSIDKQLGEIRAYPLSEEEMFGSTEGGKVFANAQGIKDRVVFLTGARFKDDKTKEPVGIWGNLHRIDGYIDGDVEFRPYEGGCFHIEHARFFFSFLPQNKEPLKTIYKPPQYIERVIGVDPYNDRYEAKSVVKQSNGAMVGRQFRDLHTTGCLNIPFMTYCCRPQHQDTFFEDCIRAAIFNRAYLQIESKSDKLANYAEDRGYEAWLLNRIGSMDNKRKGDAPSGGKNAFLNEGIGLIEANTNTPLTLTDEYWLDNHWHIDLLQDYLKLTPADTHANDLSMADIQALIGQTKILYKKIRQPSPFNELVYNYIN